MLTSGDAETGASPPRRTTVVAIDTTTPRTRRALLGAGFGAIAATIASALGKPLPVNAEGETIRVGGEYEATSETVIWNRTNRRRVLVVGSDADRAAITGYSSGGIGVAGIGGEPGTGV
jgi:hypothetical protein